MKKNNMNSLVGILSVLIVFGFIGLPSASAVGPLPVDLLSTNNFIIFANTAVANPGGAGTFTGDIGTGPGITSTAITGFSLILPASGAFSTSALVTGNIYAFDYAVPTPTAMNTASNDMLTAYNDAAGRPTPTATELGAGDISGMTLVAGTYKWSTGVLINTDVTLSGGASDVWIFQIAGDLDVASGGSVPSGIKVILSGGAQASNIFWQVGGPTGATLGTYSTFNGNILSAKQVILQTGAVLNGRALAQTQVTLDANTVSMPVSAPTTGPVFIDTNLNNTLDSGEQFFNTIQDAVNSASTTGDTIVLNSDITISSQITISKSLTLNGNSFTLHSTFAKTNNSNNSAIGIIDASNVTIKNLIQDGTGSTNLHGINIYQSTGVNLNDITVSNNGRIGIGINGSVVTTNNITTSNNGWGGINVDLGSGVTMPAILTLNGLSSHSETGPSIWLDDVTKNVSVVDTNNQYSSVNTGNLRVYKLKSVLNPTVDLGTFVGGIGTTTATTTINNGVVNVEITVGTVSTSEDTNWDGVINSPVATSTPTILPDPGNVATAVMAIEVGDGDTLITFNQPVKLIFIGQAGNFVGSYRAGVFTPITATCDSLTAPTLGAGADCKIVDGSDLIVWTKHFTVFVTYTQVPVPVVVPTPSPSSGGGGGPSGLFGQVSNGAGGFVTPGGVIAQASPQAVANVTGQVLGVATFNFGRNLSNGSTGDDVTELQKKLKEEGVYSGPISGYFGSLTSQAVKMFQAKYGIGQAGVVGPQTRNKLNSFSVTSVPGCEGGNKFNTQTGTPCVAGAMFGAAVSAFARSLQVGSQGDDVTKLQERLTREGVYSGPVTGYFGPLTREAVKKFQENRGLEQVGQVGPKTRAELNK